MWGAIFWIVVLVGGGVWFYDENQTSGGLSGKQYYEACWELKSKSAGFNQPKPSNPYQAGQWKHCEPVVRRIFFKNGLIFSGAEEGGEYANLRRVCPSTWSDVPIGGLYYLFIQDMEKDGGVSGFLGALPASIRISSWINERWPDCRKEREREGYSKIIERSDGQFVWEKPCPKCK